jgi:uncharacterized C2H2 Zn-finger protein
MNRKKPCIVTTSIQSKKSINPINPINSNTSDQIANIINKIDNSVIESIPINNNTCPHCKKVFFQKSNVQKHVEKQSCKIIKNKIKNSNQEMIDKIKELFNNHTSNITNNNITNNTTNNNTTNNNITNNINIQIFSAGKEDLSRLTQEEILKICTSGTYYPIVAAEIIHCNEKYPEFQNFLISNLRSNTGLVLINDKWISKSQDEILSNIMSVDKKHVSNLIKDLKVDTKNQIKLESTKDEIETNESKEHQKPKIKTRLYNASKMVMKNKKNVEKTITE